MDAQCLFIGYLKIWGTISRQNNKRDWAGVYSVGNKSMLIGGIFSVKEWKY